MTENNEMGNTSASTPQYSDSQILLGHYLADASHNDYNVASRNLEVAKRKHAAAIILTVTILATVIFWGIGVPMSSSSIGVISGLGTLLFAIGAVPFLAAVLGVGMPYSLYYLDVHAGKRNKADKPDISNTFVARLLGYDRLWFKYRAPHVDPADYEIFFGENYKEWMQKFDDLKKTLPAIPEHYDNIYAITWLLTYFDEGRADSMKEAMNLFEQEEIQAPMQRQRDNVRELRSSFVKRGLRLFFPNQAN